MSQRLVIPMEPFTWSQLRELGWARHQLNDRLADGTLKRVLHNVYQPADLPDEMSNRAKAASLVASPFSVFCDRTAAWLHGVDVYDYRDLEILPPLDCFVLRDRHRIARPECRSGERDLTPGDICLVGGLRVTTPLRTGCDLACLLPRPDGLSALDMVKRLHGVRQVQLEGSVPRFRGRRGVVKFRGLAPLANGLAESPGESRTRLAVHDAGIPAPQLQFWVTHQGIPLFRLDLAWPKSRVALEYDGEEWHERTQAQRDADRARRRWLREHGWTVIVVKKGSFSFEAKTAWLGALKEALRLPY